MTRYEYLLFFNSLSGADPLSAGMLLPEKFKPEQPFIRNS
jgi:hypothetical protein